LPLSGLTFLNTEQIESFDYKNISVEGHFGYMYIGFKIPY